MKYIVSVGVAESTYFTCRVSATLCYRPHVGLPYLQCYAGAFLQHLRNARVPPVFPRSYLIFPYVSYCNIVWGASYKSHLHNLFVLQKRVVRMICKLPYLATSLPSFI